MLYNSFTHFLTLSLSYSLSYLLSHSRYYLICVIEYVLQAINFIMVRVVEKLT